MNIKAVIKNHGLTIKEVAERMGITRVTLMQILQRESYTTRTLKRIADAIGCDIKELYETEGVEEMDVHGFISIDGELNEFTDKEELRSLINKIFIDSNFQSKK